MVKGKIAIFILGILLFFSHFTYAFTIAIPTGHFEITLNDKNVPDQIFYAAILKCTEETFEFHFKNLIPQLNINQYDPKKNCYWKTISFEECSKGKCILRAFWNNFKLAVYLPSQNKVYISDEIEKSARWNPTFKANLLSDGGIEIKEIVPIISGEYLIVGFIFLVFNLIVEISWAHMYISIIKIPKKMLASVLIANLISFPIMWIILYFIEPINLFILLVIELFVVILEGYIIYLLNKSLISLKKSFMLSFSINSISFIFGFLVITIENTMNPGFMEIIKNKNL